MLRSLLLLALAAGCRADEIGSEDTSADPRLGGEGGDDGGATDDTAPAGGGVVTFTKLVATTTVLPWPLTSVSGATQYLLTEDGRLDPDDRLYFYADYDMAGATIAEQFTVFLFQLNADYCALSGRHDLDPDAMLTGEVVDATGEAPVTIPLSPLGGQGVMYDDLGVNVWDITDVALIDTRCAGPPSESLDYSTAVPYVLFWQYEGYGATVRAFRIYVGRAL